MSQSTDTADADADADADKDVDVVFDSLCFSCPPIIVIEQCKLNLIVDVLFVKKMRSCVAYLWLTQPFQTVCANGFPIFEMITCLFPAATSDVQRNSKSLSLG